MDMGESMINNKKDVDNNVDNIVSTDVETNEDVMEDFYKYHEKMMIPICFYKDDERLTFFQMG